MRKNDMKFYELNDTRFSSLENEYFSIFIEVCEFSSNLFYARCEIKRKDTQESVGEEVSCESRNKNHLLDNLYETIKGKMLNIEKPMDWDNPDLARRVINEHINFLEKLSNIWMQVEAGNKSSIAEIRDCFGQAIQLVKNHTKLICGQLNGLDDEVLLRIVNCDDSSFYVIENAKEIDAMTDLYLFINNPSQSIVDANIRHIKKVEESTSSIQ